MRLGPDDGFWIPGLHRMLFQLFFCPVAAVWNGVGGLVDYVATRGTPPSEGDPMYPNIAYDDYQSRVGLMHHHLIYAGVFLALFLQYMWKRWRADRHGRAMRQVRVAA